MDHPLGTSFGSGEALGDLQPLGELLLVLLGLGGAEFLLKFDGECRKVDLFEEFHDRFRTHHRIEGAVTVGVLGITDFDFGEKLAHFEGGVALIGDDVVLVVDDALELAGAHVEHQADARRHALVEPDVGNRHGELDVTHALATDAAEGDFDAAAVANDALVLDALVFSAGTFPVTGRPEDAFAEETAFLRFEGPVVDGLGILDLTFGPAPDDFRRGDGDGDLVKGFGMLVHAKDFAKVGIDTHNR